MAAGLFAAYLLFNQARTAWHERQAVTARSGSASIHTFLQGALSDARGLERLGPDVLERSPGLAEGVLARTETLLEVAYLEPGGRWIGGAWRDEARLVPTADGMAPDWFEAACQGHTYFGDVDGSSGEGSFSVVAGPADSGRVVAARVRLDVLSEMLPALAPTLGEALLVDQEARLVARAERPVGGQAAGVQPGSDLAVLARTAGDALLSRCRDLEGRSALCAASPIAGTRWVFIATTPWSEALAPVVRLLASMALVLIGLALAAGVVSWWRLAALVFRPLKELQAGAERVGRGDLEPEITSPRRDEIGRLAGTLNDMTARLRAQRQAIEGHTRQLESLNQVSVSLTRRLDLESVLATVLGAAFDLFPDLMDALVFLYADDRLSLAAWRKRQGAEDWTAPAPRPEGSTYTVARTGEMILIPDVHTDARYPGDPTAWPGALACVPLKVGLRVVGVLNTAYDAPHAFSQEETKLLQLLADQVAIAIENARLYGQAQQELMERRRAEQALQKSNEDLERKVASRTRALLEANQRLETLKEIDRSILAAQSMLDIAVAGLSRVRTLIGCEHASLALFDADHGEVRLLAVDGPRPFGFEAGATFALDDYGPMEDLRAGGVRRVDDLKAIGELTPLRQRLLEAGVRSFLTVPLVADGSLIGEVNLDSPRPSAFDIDAELLAREVANQLAIALRQAGLRAALETEQRRLGQLVEHLPQAVALLDGDKRVILANALAREILPDLGRWPSTATLQQVGGRPIERLLVSEGHPGWHELRLEAGPRKVYEAAALQLGQGTEAAGWIVQIRDVTSERSAQMQQRSQERLAAVGQLAAGIAHDFNNIISVIILYAELLLQAQGRAPQDIERLQTITQQGQRGAQLVQQILDFSRQSVMEQHPFDLVPFLREMEGLLMRTLPETIRVRMVAEGTGYMIQGDPARIRQACINLALNAREAMPEGGDLRFSLASLILNEGDPTPCVEMDPGEWVRLAVSDTGSGIQPEVLPHIFEPFFTTKSPAKASGLGLAQVYGIIQQHHGHIDVASAKDGGTTFNIYLPALEAPPATGSGTEAPEAHRGRGETILVVEDNDATRASVGEILTNLGYRVLQASEGKEAMDVFARESGKIDLILSDLVMPGMGGSELVRQLTAAAPQQRFLLMTGYPLGSTRELLESGTVHWMQKPLSGAKLARAVREALGTGPLP